MKIKSFLVAVFIGLLTMSACTTGTNDQSLEENKIREGTIQERDRIVDELDPARDDAVDDELSNQLGYVNYTRDQVENEAEQNREINMDWEQMADNLTRTILSNDDFTEVATLVTDQDVLIVYSYDDDDLDEATAADIVKKTAVSMMPGFYDVYVSDNEALFNDVRSLHNSTSTSKHGPTIDRIIEEMKKSKQGLDED